MGTKKKRTKMEINTLVYIWKKGLVAYLGGGDYVTRYVFH